MGWLYCNKAKRGVGRRETGLVNTDTIIIAGDSFLVGPNLLSSAINAKAPKFHLLLKYPRVPQPLIKVNSRGKELIRSQAFLLRPLLPFCGDV